MYCSENLGKKASVNLFVQYEFPSNRFSAHFNFFILLSNKFSPLQVYEDAVGFGMHQFASPHEDCRDVCEGCLRRRPMEL